MSQANDSVPQPAAASATPAAPTAPKVIPPGMLPAFILVTGLFSLWGFANDISNPMVAAFKETFLISHFQSSLMQTAFYSGYCVMAIPAALFLRRFSYKQSILVGLALYSIGCILFLPASSLASFGYFLLGYFVMTAGLSFLETTANPYILSLGPQETATRRLNLAQAFNPLGSITGMLIAGAFILVPLGDNTDAAIKKIGELQHPVADVVLQDAVGFNNAALLTANDPKIAAATAVKDAFLAGKTADALKLAEAAGMKPNEAFLTGIFAEGGTSTVTEKIKKIYPAAKGGKNLIQRFSDWVRGTAANAAKAGDDPVAKAYPNANSPLQSKPKSEVVRHILNDPRVKENAPAAFGEVQAADLKIIMLPYLALGLVVAAVFGLFYVAKLAGSAPSGASSDPERAIVPTLGRLFRNGAYWQGVVSQAFYVGVQIMCWTFIIQYAVTEFGMSKTAAQNWNIVAMASFVLSRFICTYLLKFVSPGGLLAVLAAGGAALILGVMFFSTGALGAAGGVGINNFTLFDTGLAAFDSTGVPVAGAYFLPAGLVCLVAVSACMSLMFPTIYGIALRDLDNEDAKLGSAGLILAIGGGAVFPPLQGWLIDQEAFFKTFGFIDSTRASFVVAFVCFLVILAYGLRTKFVHHAKTA